jgi:hypothetical protein
VKIVERVRGVERVTYADDQGGRSGNERRRLRSEEGCQEGTRDAATMLLFLAIIRGKLTMLVSNFVH